VIKQDGTTTLTILYASWNSMRNLPKANYKP
jgi:hypothetical protein